MRTFIGEVLRQVRAARRSNRVRRLSRRWKKSVSPRFPIHDQGSSGLRIQSLVLNLDARQDRLTKVKAEMEKLQTTDWERIGAVNGAKKFPHLSSFFAGSLGCTLSHIDALQLWQAKSLGPVMICEDDIEFVGSPDEIRTCIDEFLATPQLDILALSGRARGGSYVISPKLRVVVGMVGRGCYLVKPHMIEPLVAAFDAGVSKLLAGDRKGKGDRMWSTLQNSHFFAMPRVPLARQSEGFSDIEGRELGPR